MEETKVIKVLLLSSQEIVVSEIEEIAAEFGDPNCKLTKPYKIEGGALPVSYTHLTLPTNREV